MRVRRLLLPVLALGLFAVLSGCGGESTETEDLDDPLPTVEVTTTCVDRVDAIVFVNPALDAARVEAIGAALAAVPGVVEITYVDQQQAYQEFRTLFADSPEMLEGLEPSSLPTSFRVTLDDPARAEDIRTLATGLDGVGQVVLGSEGPPQTGPTC